MTIILDPKKFSQLTEVTSLDGEELLPIVKSGENKSVKVKNLPEPANGVPDGGTAGQVLAKRTSANQDTRWVDQSGGPGGPQSYDEYVYNSTGIQTENRYNNWSELMDAIATGQYGPTRITFEQNETLPVGEWDLDYVVFNGNGQVATLGGIFVTIPDGFTLGGSGKWLRGALDGGLGLNYDGSVPLIDIDSGVYLYDMVIGNTLVCSDAPLLKQSGTAITIIRAAIGSQICPPGSVECFEVSGTGGFIVSIGSSSAGVGSNAVKGDVTTLGIAQVVLEASSSIENLTRTDANLVGSMTIVRVANAELVDFTPGASGMISANAGDAIKEAFARATAWGQITGDITDQADLQAVFALMATLTGAETLTNKTITQPTLTLKQSASPTPTAEGDMQWDTDDNVILIGTGGSTKEIVNTDNPQTLSNKTLTSPVLNTAVSGSAVDTDNTMAANSDTLLASQKAIRSHVYAKTAVILPTSGDYYSMGGQAGAVSAAGSGLSAAGKICFHPMLLAAGTLDRIAVSSTIAAVSTWRLGLYKANPLTGLPDGQTPFLDAGTVNMNATPGVQEITISKVITEPGLYWAAVMTDAYTAAPTVHSCIYSSNSGGAFHGLPQDMSSLSRYRVGRVYGSTVPTGSLPTAPTASMTWAGTVPRVAVRYA